MRPECTCVVRHMCNCCSILYIHLFQGLNSCPLCFPIWRCCCHLWQLISWLYPSIWITVLPTTTVSNANTAGSTCSHTQYTCTCFRAKFLFLRTVLFLWCHCHLWYLISWHYPSLWVTFLCTTTMSNGQSIRLHLCCTTSTLVHLNFRTDISLVESKILHFFTSFLEK